MRRRDVLRQSAACAVALGAASLGGCGALPRSGPTTAAFIDDPEDDRDPLDGLVTRLTAEVAQIVGAPPPPSFPPAFLSAGPIDPTVLGVDDVVDVTIWESEGAGVLNAEGGATVIDRIAVDPSGRLFIPFAGQQRAAGATVAALRERIQTALEPLTLSPQVDIRLVEPRSRMIALQGDVAQPGVYPIERATRRLAPMLARAGGARDEPERLEVVVQRDAATGRQLLSDVLEDPASNIALRPGDLVTVAPIRERFVVLGATSVQAELGFPKRPLDLLSAIGAARGLIDFDADPSGVFLLRYEDPAVADALLPAPEPPGLPPGSGRPIVYRLDLTEPQGFFIARAFQMRDDDAIFTTNAPLTELRKFLQLFNSVVTPVNTVNTLPVQ